jgi:general secretion pathway protein A
MYLQHFGFKRAPFSLESDPDVFWPGGGPAAALAALQRTFTHGRAVAVLTGDPGTGKTLLLNRLRWMLAGGADIAAVPNPALGLSDLYRILFSELNMGSTPDDPERLRSAFQNTLYATRAAGRRVVLMIDEAQRMPTELFRELTTMSGDAADPPLCTLILAGQTGFPERLAAQAPEAVRRFPSTRLHLGPLTEAETVDYVRHRLKTAGAPQDLFRPESLRAISRACAGLPRVINLLCDHALLSAFTAGEHEVGPDAVTRCVGELGLTVPSMETNSSRETDSSREPRRRESSSHGRVRTRAAAWSGVAAAAVIASWVGAHLIGRTEISAPPAPVIAMLPAEPQPVVTAPPLDEPATPAVSEEEPAPEASLEALDPGPSAAPTADAPAEVPSAPEPAPPAPIAPAVTEQPSDLPRAFRIAFRPQSAEIDPASYESLRELSRMLNSRPGTRLTVQAFAEPGSKYALKLYEFRVSALKSYLTGSSSAGAPVRIRVSETPAGGAGARGASSLLEVRAEN